MFSMRTLTAASLVLLPFLSSVLGYDHSRSDNVAVYWGQNSEGRNDPNSANWQKNLSTYCQDDAIDAFQIAFVNVFVGQGGVPSINLANICSPTGSPVFNGTQMPDCSFMASDIKTCQAAGKIVTLSFGGDSGAYAFSSASAAAAYGDLVWNLFLGGSSNTRPFGDAVLDGIDLDIEGGSTLYYDSFLSQLQTHFSGASKKYYVSAAPQCEFPDGYLGTLLDQSFFDSVYVQFYNNPCGVANFNSPNAWTFGAWDNWAKTQSKNPNVKIYIGAPASASAANSGYVDVNTLGSIATQTRSQYSSFGGIMLWDESQAYFNNRFDAAIKKLIKTSGGGSGTTTTTSHTTTTSSTSHTTSTTTTTSPASTTTPPSSGSCSGVAAWSATVAYNGGTEVVYNGSLYKANWWSYGSLPTGTDGSWSKVGACSSSKSTPTNVKKMRVYREN